MQRNINKELHCFVGIITAKADEIKESFGHNHESICYFEIAAKVADRVT